MTTEQRKREIFDQPCAFKLVYSPENGINAHVILRGPDCWHMLYGNNVLPRLEGIVQNLEKYIFQMMAWLS